jgi:hypothetical protein
MAVGTLVPAPLGVLLVLAWSMIFGPKPIHFDELWSVPLDYISVALVGYVLVGAQSVVFALLLEYAINRHLGNDATALASSVLLGVIAAVSVLFIFPKWDSWFAGMLIVIGATVGFIVGHIVRRMYKQAANSAAQSNATTSALNEPTYGAPGRGS